MKKAFRPFWRWRCTNRRHVRACLWSIERAVLSLLVNQPDIILFMATFGLTLFPDRIWASSIFGGNPKVMIAEQLLSARGRDRSGRFWAASSPCRRSTSPPRSSLSTMIAASCRLFFQYTRIGRALALSPDSHKAALSVGISLNQIWVIVWFIAGVVALITRHHVGRALRRVFCSQVVALKALPVLILGGFTSVPGAIVGGLIIGIGEKIGEFYWGPFGRRLRGDLARLRALPSSFSCFRPQGLFGERIIERIWVTFQCSTGRPDSSRPAMPPIARSFPSVQERIGARRRSRHCVHRHSALR